ncbi:MAG: site-specific DNA-methyltransferase [Parvibaculaceae bacterium]
MKTSKNQSSRHREDNRYGPAGRISIIYRTIKELQPDPRNPRSHSAKQIGQIARSIETFGFNAPLLIDQGLKIIAGHGRLLAAKKLGWDNVPTISLEHLTEAEARAYMIADNRLTDTSVWDDGLLAEHLEFLTSIDCDFSIEATGFDMGEIDFMIEGAKRKDEKEDEAPVEIAQGKPISRPGDIWILGEHRILCGSALDPDAYTRLMNGNAASVVFTDPPYNLEISGNVSGLGAIQHREFAMASGEMNEATFTAFLSSSLKLLAKHSTQGSIHFVCMDWRHILELGAAGREVYSELKNLCVWTKHNAGMGSFYRSQHELVFVFKNGTVPHQNNVQLGKFGRNRTNVWAYPGANSFGRGEGEGNPLAMHPTVKPVALVADALLDASARRDIVLDAFLGSGTTLIAAEKTGRVCYGIEIDPLYVDTAIRRWQKLTTQHALRENGATFESMEAEDVE